MYPNLKLQIFKLGIHQNRVARALGVDDSVLSKMIHGYREPSPAQRRQLAGLLQVEEKWLFEKFDGLPHSNARVNSVPPPAGEDDGT